jgi:hypothetical protein
MLNAANYMYESKRVILIKVPYKSSIPKPHNTAGFLDITMDLAVQSMTMSLNGYTWRLLRIG